MISVIIPIYNAAGFLKRCVDSVLAQTYRDLEILLVDDGSTDCSPDICDEYAAQVPQVRVFHCKNRGLSAARNTGIDNASADYYVFVDSDDEILPTMIEELYYALCKTGADIAVCGFYQINEEHPMPPVTRRTSFDPDAVGEIRVYSGSRKMDRLIHDNLVTTVQWNKLYKKEIFTNIRYPVGKYHEDEFVIHRELDAAEKIAYIDRKLYLYYRHRQSITRNPTAEKAYHVLEAYSDRLCFLAKRYDGVAIGNAYCVFSAYYSNLKSDMRRFADA